MKGVQSAETSFELGEAIRFRAGAPLDVEDVTKRVRELLSLRKGQRTRGKKILTYSAWSRARSESEQARGIGPIAR